MEWKWRIVGKEAEIGLRATILSKNKFCLNLLLGLMTWWHFIIACLIAIKFTLETQDSTKKFNKILNPKQIYFHSNFVYSNLYVFITLYEMHYIQNVKCE